MTDPLRDRVQEIYACALRGQRDLGGNPDVMGPWADCTQNLKDALLAVLDVCDDSDAYPPHSPMGSGYAIACRSIRHRIQRTLEDDEEPALDVDGYLL